MKAQFRALGETELWNFLRSEIEKKYGIKVILLRAEIGIEGSYDKVKELCLNSCIKA